MSSSATAADKKRTQTPSFVGRWPDIPKRIMQDAQQKVAPRGVTLSLQPHRLEFKLEASLCERLAVLRLLLAIRKVLRALPTACCDCPCFTLHVCCIVKFHDCSTKQHWCIPHKGDCSS